MVRQAAFKGLREDKPAAEVSTGRPTSPDEIDPNTTQKKLAKGATGNAKGSAVVMGVVFPNPTSFYGLRKERTKGSATRSRPVP
jgi:bifunctional non-homologous end joining protein LigD